MNIARLLHRASRTFQYSTGHSAALSEPLVLKDWQRSLVVRCRVESDHSDISSVIIKQIKEDAACGFSDWASLAFLSGLPEANGIVPHFYGGDAENRFFLMEDLAGATNLQDVLAGDDATTARAALQTLAVQMARMQAATLGREHEFTARRAVLPEAEFLGRHREAGNWLDNRAKIFDWFEAANCAPPSSFEDCLTRIAEIFAEPGDFLTFTHGDPAPTNNFFLPGRTGLLDFEYGGYRHALYDITAWNILCPMPAECMRDMNESFRTELARTLPAARDEARFAEAYAFLCAFRASAILTWISPDIMEENRPWVEDWSAREAVLAAVSRMEKTTATSVRLEPVCEAAGTLRKALRRRWHFADDDIAPKWHAFG